jgi:hypothetical protein
MSVESFIDRPLLTPLFIPENAFFNKLRKALQNLMNLFILQFGMLILDRYIMYRGSAIPIWKTWLLDLCEGL